MDIDQETWDAAIADRGIATAVLSDIFEDRQVSAYDIAELAISLNMVPDWKSVKLENVRRREEDHALIIELALHQTPKLAVVDMPSELQPERGDEEDKSGIDLTSDFELQIRKRIFEHQYQSLRDRELKILSRILSMKRASINELHKLNEALLKVPDWSSLDILSFEKTSEGKYVLQIEFALKRVPPEIW